MSFYVAGLDLGQARDYSALCVVEATPTQHHLTVEGIEREFGLPIDRELILDGPPVSLALRARQLPHSRGADEREPGWASLR